MLLRPCSQLPASFDMSAACLAGAGTYTTVSAKTAGLYTYYRYNLGVEAWHFSLCPTDGGQRQIMDMSDCHVSIPLLGGTGTGEMNARFFFQLADGLIWRNNRGALSDPNKRIFDDLVAEYMDSITPMAEEMAAAIRALPSKDAGAAPLAAEVS